MNNQTSKVERILLLWFILLYFNTFVFTTTMSQEFLEPLFSSFFFYNFEINITKYFKVTALDILPHVKCMLVNILTFVTLVH